MYKHQYIKLACFHSTSFILETYQIFRVLEAFYESKFTMKYLFILLMLTSIEIYTISEQKLYNAMGETDNKTGNKGSNGKI